jgi:triacylglycerol esterase/lipase EstA (alpha/beta hydrolase family)
MLHQVNTYLLSFLRIRQAYAHVKEELTKLSNNKVVLIVHSQGAIEGSMIIDWLLSYLPEDKL